MANRTIEFFETEFRRRAGAIEQLSSFHEAALPHVSGRVLDLACGLGTFSFPREIAQGGWEVVARQAGESPAPGDTVRRFETIVARKPAARG